MNVLIIACSRQAYNLMKKLEKVWKEKDPDINIICKVKCSSLPDISEKCSIRDCVGEWFNKVDAIVFISAAGIAVRSIAPFIKHKSVDLAVVVVDEKGKFSISLLSGHSGGANELAEKIGSMLGALPVVTTATDREGKFAVDDFARKNRLIIKNWELAKKIAVDILEGNKIGIYSEIVLEGKMPEELYLCSLSESKIIISYRKQNDNILQLIPKIVAVGIGCRKNTSEDKIAFAINSCLKEENIMSEAVVMVSSINIKKEEKGITDYCKKMNLPFITYSAEELKNVYGDFASSDFVESITGVSNVCERSAVAASKGRLICKKKVYDGVTVALAEMKGCAVFE